MSSSAFGPDTGNSGAARGIAPSAEFFGLAFMPLHAATASWAAAGCTIHTKYPTRTADATTTVPTAATRAAMRERWRLGSAAGAGLERGVGMRLQQPELPVHLIPRSVILQCRCRCGV